MNAIVTLLTDFGTADGYVAEMKGVLLRHAPGVRIVDLAHDIPPGDVEAGAYAIGRAWRAFPPETVHCCVVDPGVGTARRAIAAAVAGQFVVGPDNGLFTEVFAEGAEAIVTLAIPLEATATFHGRDVFAPAAAALARGKALATLGTPCSDPVRLRAPILLREGEDVVGEVVHVDRFGTLITNLPAARIAAAGTVRLGPYDLALRRTFADVAVGDPVAYVGSGGTVEVAVREGRADVLLGQARGARVRATARRSPD
jgi:hypothetical protein